MEYDKPQYVEKVKTSSAAWLGAANAFTGLLVAFAEGSAVTYFFVNHLGLDPKFNAVSWILFGIWNAINDPIYGFLADRTHSKLGRRKPWIRYGAPLIALFFALTWISFPSMQGNNWFLFFQELLALFLFDIVYTAIASAIYVMPYEMAVTNKARNKIFLWNIGFSLISFGAPMVLNSYLDKLIEEQSAVFPWIMAAAGIICGIVIFVSTFFYKENDYVVEEKQPRFWEGLKMCIKNKSFLYFEVLSWTVIFAQNALMIGLTYVQGMWANDAMAGINGWMGSTSILILYGALIVGAVAGILFFVFMRDKLGTRVNTLICVGCMGAGCLLSSFLGMYFYVLLLSFFLIGIGFSGGLYLVPMVNGDVMDKDELDNGARREGVYAGINSLITKPAGAIAQAIFPWMMTSFFNFQPDKKIDGVTDWVGQPDSAKNGLFICWMLITGILLVLSFVAMWFYPLHGKEWNHNKEMLAIEHQKKQEAYEQEILAKMQEKEIQKVDLEQKEE